MVGGGQRGGWHYGHRLRPRQISAEVARRERTHVTPLRTSSCHTSPVTTGATRYSRRPATGHPRAFSLEWRHATKKRST
jgi:hypothetical protein